MRVMRNTTHFGRLPNSCVSGVALAVRCYNELSTPESFCIPTTFNPSEQIDTCFRRYDIVTPAKVETIYAIRYTQYEMEEVPMGKSYRLSNGLNLRQGIGKN